MAFPDVVPLVIVVVVKTVGLVTVTIYLPEETLPVLTSRKTVLPLDKPCALEHVTVTVDPVRE